MPRWLLIRRAVAVSVVYRVPEGAAHFLLILADPRGSIPSALVNSQAKAAPKKWHKVNSLLVHVKRES